jgi:hypothetical protein
VHNILAATTMQSKAASASAPKLGWKGRISEMLSDIAQPLRALVREPRLLMTAAMAIFSVTLSLNLVGVKVSDLKHIDLRPSAMREAATIRYTEASNRVIQYYYSIRLVYEVESRLQELKRATSAEEEPRQQQSQPPRDKTENNKKDHERKQNYYSMERQNGLLASGSPNTLNPSSIQQTEQPALEFAVARNIAQNKNCMSPEPSHGFEQDKSIRGLLA